jgi:hypothetical protein
MNTDKLKDKYVTEFVTTITYLVNSLFSTNRRDDDIIQMRDRYFLVKDENPELLLIQTGPYVWEFREKIMDDDIDFFLNNSFQKQIDSFKQDKEKPMINTLIQKIKTAWKNFTPIEQNILRGKIKDLVKFYACYLSACKTK